MSKEATPEARRARKCGDASSAATARATSGARSGSSSGASERTVRRSIRRSVRRSRGEEALAVPEPGVQPLVDARRRLAVRRRVLADQLGDLDQRVRGPQPDRVEQRVLDQERAAAVVGVAGVAVGAREVHEAVVGGVVGALGGVDVAAVLALVGLDALGRQLDRGQRLVPGRRVVEPGLPRVHDRRQPAAAHVAAPGEVGVLVGEAPEDAPQERRAVLAAARDLQRRARVQRRLRQPGGGDAVDVALPERGPGEVGVLGHVGVEDDVRDAAVGPLAAQQRLELGRGPRRVHPRPADRDVRGVPAPLVRVLAPGGHGRGAAPVGGQHRPRRSRASVIPSRRLA